VFPTLAEVEAANVCPADLARELTGHVVRHRLPQDKAHARLRALVDARAGRCDCTGCKTRTNLDDLAGHVGISRPRLSNLLTLAAKLIPAGA
jgi:hypothetical protein